MGRAWLSLGSNALETDLIATRLFGNMVLTQLLSSISLNVFGLTPASSKQPCHSRKFFEKSCHLIYISLPRS